MIFSISRTFDTTKRETLVRIKSCIYSLDKTTAPKYINCHCDCMSSEHYLLCSGRDHVMSVCCCLRHRDHIALVMPYFQHDRFVVSQLHNRAHYIHVYAKDYVMYCRSRDFRWWPLPMKIKREIFCMTNIFNMLHCVICKTFSCDKN